MPGTIDQAVEQKRDQQGKPDKNDPDGAMKGAQSGEQAEERDKDGQRKSPRESDE